MPYGCALFLFRRDLRLHDNSALRLALEQSNTVIPLFVVDPVQVNTTNKYRSMHALTYMLESLLALRDDLAKNKHPLFIVADNPVHALKRLLHDYPIEALFVNADYTPYSTLRDEQIQTLCTEKGVVFHALHDALLIGDPHSLLTQQKTPYRVFTAFFRNALLQSVTTPLDCSLQRLWKGDAPAYAQIAPQEVIPLYHPPSTTILHGGSTAAKKQLLHACKTLQEYAFTRDIPALPTSLLSAINKFGTLSIRTVFHTISNYLGSDHPLIRQLYWRDFFTYIAYHQPSVFGEPYNKRFEAIEWENDSELFYRWQAGETGFPLVDAGMRQLKETGFLHNRVRMVTASFLIKDLHCDWRWGERYFAQHLIDYDPSVNNGNWQWVASTGCDAMPYMRIFNPITQQMKFDPEAEYIRQWVPELYHYDAKTIHLLAKGKNKIKGYPVPCIDHEYERKRALVFYRAALHK